jgi:general secretion pathway protein G
MFDRPSEGNSMYQQLRAARRREHGFTLIELLIVIVVLGVLAGIVVFGVATFNSDAKTAACKADVKLVDTAASAFYAKTNAWPADVATLVTAKYLKTAPPEPMNISSEGVVTPTTPC